MSDDVPMYRSGFARCRILSTPALRAGLDGAYGVDRYGAYFLRESRHGYQHRRARIAARRGNFTQLDGVRDLDPGLEEHMDAGGKRPAAAGVALATAAQRTSKG